jgi:hypothetical protein
MDFDMGLRKSCGWLHCLFLDHASGRTRVLSARRGRASKDKRVRLRTTKILPVRELKPLMSDPYHPVRTSVINRIGIDNCYKHYLDDKDGWIRTAAVCAAEIDEIPYKDMIESAPKEPYSGRIILSIISKLESEELLYLLDLPKEIGSQHLKQQISDVISARLKN